MRILKYAEPTHEWKYPTMFAVGDHELKWAKLRDPVFHYFRLEGPVFWALKIRKTFVLCTPPRGFWAPFSVHNLRKIIILKKKMQK